MFGWKIALVSEEEIYIFTLI